MIRELTRLDEPFFHSYIGSESDFYDLMHSHKENQEKIVARYIRGNKCVTIQDFYNEFSAAFQFPYYFGENSAAFDECINDLEWIPSKGYIIFISNAQSILTENAEDFRRVIETLADSAQEWSEGRDYGELSNEPTPFHIVLHSENENQNELLSSRLSEVGISNINTISIN